jgi:hypothetical protein
MTRDLSSPRQQIRLADTNQEYDRIERGRRRFVGATDVHLVAHHPLGVIDPEVGQGLRARNERRRNALRVLVGQYSVSELFIKIQEQVVLDKLHMLTSFETFDALAINGRTTDDVYQILKRMADETLGNSPRPIFRADPVKIEPRLRRRSRSSRRRSQS